MDPKRWAQVKELLAKVADCETAQRDEVMADIRRADPALCEEVEGLLRELDQTLPLGRDPFENLAVLAREGVRLLDDRYLLDREIGRGAFGVVYLAFDERLHRRPVVVKFMTHAIVNDSWFQQKFDDEIKALALIDHAGVIGIRDAGRTATGTPFLVMDYVEGVSLRSVIAQGGAEFDRVANLLQQIGDALAAAHSKGVLHRDLKPENIMVQQSTDRELVRLIDFGIAKIRDQALGDAAEATRIVGTVRYMAPEQFSGKAFIATDIFAMAVIAWEMLTGMVPFPETSPLAVLAAQQAGLPVARLGQLRPAIPESVRALLISALAPNPSARPQDAREFGRKLANALKEGGPAEDIQQPASVQNRVLDAAIGRQIPIHKPAELVVLVRTAESEGLIAILRVDKDYCVSEADVRSKPFQLEFPRDAAGRSMPLPLLVRLECPDFEPAEAIKKILIPPWGDSDVCTFLLIPRHLGILSVNLELIQEEILIASRALKTEAVPSDRVAADVPKTIVSIPLLVQVRERAGMPQNAFPDVRHEPAGAFTRFFEEAAAPAETPGEFTRMFTVPPTGQPAQPAAPAPPHPRQGAGEFSSSARGPSPKSGEPGEFTRMFDSPLHPAPLSPAQGAPAGEFTNMFGPGSTTPPPVAPMGTPTPRPPAGSSATNVFKTPPASEFTTMMTRPTSGILTQAAATAEPEKKSFFKTYLPMILFFGALLLVLLVILIYFATRKH